MLVRIPSDSMDQFRLCMPEDLHSLTTNIWTWTFHEKKTDYDDVLKSMDAAVLPSEITLPAWPTMQH